MAQRLREPDLTTTVTAIIQAERLGGNIVYVLNDSRWTRVTSG